ncbi:MAG TPA: PIN domain-containing protein [Nostocaceae cyanobacterium]|nr:PIN domain-containing protein [Nostocaceae cyanobacterium]
MVTLYIETNFFMGFAKNQDQEAEDLVNTNLPGQMPEIKIVTPSVCCMESFSVLEIERNRNNYFQDTLEKERTKLQGDINSQYSREIQGYLEQAKIKNNARINEINIRLFEVLKWATENVELIKLEPHILRRSIEEEFITDPTDNLILHCILDHAKTTSDEQKVFLSGNFTDFGTKEIKKILDEAGIKRYFTKTREFLGWLRSTV